MCSPTYTCTCTSTDTDTQTHRQKLTRARVLACLWLPELEQLDLLGAASITESGLRHLLQSCPNMALLDVSFCRNITLEVVGRLREEFPAM